MTTSRWSSRWARLALTVSAMMVTLALCEVVVRIVFSDDVDPVRLAAANERVFIGDIVQPSRDPDLQFELRPTLDRRWHGHHLRTDADGLRVGGSPADSAPAIKIALLGDSTAFGWGVAYRDTYAERVERMVAAHTGRSAVVRNYAVPGYNSQQQRICFQQNVLAWEPDIVIIHYDHNDADPSRERPATYMPPEFGDNVVGSALIKLVRRRLRTLAVRADMRRADDGDVRVDGYRVAGRAYEEHLRALDTIGAKAHARGIPVVVVIFDTWLTRDQDYTTGTHYQQLHAPLHRRFATNGFVVVDMLPPFQNLMETQGWTDLKPTWNSADDAHPNRGGHQFIANHLFHTMLENGMIDRVTPSDDVP